MRPSILFAVLVAFQVAVSPAAGHAGHNTGDSCAFGDGIADANKDLTVAGQAFGSTDVELATAHHTIFVPTNAAFTALLKKLNLTAAQLLTDPKNKDVLYGTLAYHVLAPEGHYTDASLVGNKTITTQLGALGNASYPLTFAQPAGAKSVQITAKASKASTVGQPTRICDREVFVIDTVLLPGSVPAKTVSNLVAASVAKAPETPAPASDSDGDDSQTASAVSGAAVTESVAAAPGQPVVAAVPAASGASSVATSCLAVVGSASILLSLVL